MTNPAYLVVDVDIKDPEGMQPYLMRVEETFLRYGGKRIVMGGRIDAIEGRQPGGRIVIIQFPGMQQAHAWHASPEYQAIIGVRQAASTSHIYLVEGSAPAR